MRKWTTIMDCVIIIICLLIGGSTGFFWYREFIKSPKKSAVIGKEISVGDTVQTTQDYLTMAHGIPISGKIVDMQFPKEDFPIAVLDTGKRISMFWLEKKRPIKIYTKIVNGRWKE